MDSGAWRATVHGPRELDTTEQLSTAQRKKTLNLLFIFYFQLLLWKMPIFLYMPYDVQIFKQSYIQFISF